MRYINFDNAASTPALMPVLKELQEFMGWYAGVHRGTGYKSLLSTQVYDDCHQIIGRYVKADLDKNAVILLKNTTEAINKLAYRLSLSAKDIVISTVMEHHSNDLPWRKQAVVKYAEVDEKGQLDIADIEKKLKQNYPRVKLLTVTGASNVTGHINDIHYLAELAHAFKARIMVDAAQLIPHQQIEIKENHDPAHIDYIAFSGHKIYAPFGVGVLIGPRDTFLAGEPEYVGGGTVNMVTRENVFWSDLPDREEAGSPNLMGAFALAKTLQYIDEIGMEHLSSYEGELVTYALQELKKVPGISIYGSKPRVGVISFNIKGINHALLGAILCYEAGMGVRNGCFCAQGYVRKLLGEKEDIKYLSAYKKKEIHRLPGMVRISLAPYNTHAEIDILVKYLKKIAQNIKHYQKSYAYSPQQCSYLPLNMESGFVKRYPI
ncbi:aminotransferase class V-fold PLP-dependent enzyme [Syntrophomonas zehnderi]|nr:aminotransferase class V-fold PLP-dependent enzyme [Syntrophomonas zehnderi]